jgi:hypothetical protein
MRDGRVVVLLVLLTCAAGIGPAAGANRGHGLGARPATAKEQAYVEERRVDVRAIAPNEISRARAQEERARGGLSARDLADRPSAVDNSTLPWFPPIGDQGYQNSCVAWAAGYYYDTYTQAMDEERDVSHGDATHTCSPAFLHPLINDGVDEGAYLDYGMARLAVIGCSSLSLAPYDVDDFTTWPSEDAWVDALSRRTQGLYRIRSNSASGVEAVKQLLANGRLGVVLIDVYANLYYDYPTARGVDSDVLYSPDGPYIWSHVVTLVGYDDEKSYTDQRDGRVHQGAFLAANSWGKSWGAANSTGASKGFVWIAYDAFLEGRLVYDVLYTDDLPDYRPQVYALVGMDHAQRGYVTLRGGVGRPDDPEATTEPVLDCSGGTGLGLRHSQRIAVDLTDICELTPDTRLTDVFVAMTVSENTAQEGSLDTAEFLSDPDGDHEYEAAEVPDLPLDVNNGETEYAFLPLFGDVPWGQWAYDDIEACYEAGIVSGYSDGSYRPEEAMTRAQMAVYIARAMTGSDTLVPAGPDSPTFTDVDIDHWAYRYVEYAAARDVVQGYSDGSYRPQRELDRGQMSAFIARAIAEPSGDALVGYVPPEDPTFPDVPADFWAYQYIEYLADPSRAVVSGYPDGRYRPDETCTRAQMAVYVTRAFALTQ